MPITANAVTTSPHDTPTCSSSTVHALLFFDDAGKNASAAGIPAR